MSERIEREKCIHVQVDVDLFDHPKAFAAGPDGVAVYLAALAYCRKHQTDGRIPRGAVMGLLGGTGARVFAKLAGPKVGWFIDHGDDVEVWNYAKKNQTKAEIEASKLKARERMRAIREGQRSGSVRANNERTTSERTANNGGTFAERSSSSSSYFSEGEVQEGAGAGAAPSSPPEPVSTTRLRLAPDPLGDNALGAEWAEGVRAGAGVGITVPRRGELQKLLDVVDTHGPARGEPESMARRAAWLREQGAAYGRANRDGKRSVFGFADWANSGGKTAPAGATRPADEAADRPYHALAKGYEPPPEKLGADLQQP